MKLVILIKLLYEVTAFKLVHPYLQYTVEFAKSVDRCVQFVSTVSSSDDIFNHRPIKDATVESLLQYILKEETKVIAKDGSYSGIMV